MADRKTIVELAQNDAQNNSSKAAETITKRHKLKIQKALASLIESAGLIVAAGILFGAFISVIYILAIALLGDRYPADEEISRKTKPARVGLEVALLYNFHELGRIEVKNDYSAIVYIQKASFMQIPFPDRTAVVSQVGKA